TQTASGRESADPRSSSRAACTWWFSSHPPRIRTRSYARRRLAACWLQLESPARRAVPPHCHFLRLISSKIHTSNTVNTSVGATTVRAQNQSSAETVIGQPRLLRGQRQQPAER